MKDPYYTMMLIKTYGALERSGNDRNCYVNGNMVQLNYPYVVQKQYTYGHDVDDHNNRRQ